MSLSFRWFILRLNALYLSVAAVAGLLFLDLRGVLTGLGPEGRLLSEAPDAGLGFVEAHGLALILGIVLWRAPVTASWHLTGAATSGLLGVSNLLFWQIFAANDALAMGYLTTALHCGVAIGQLVAATAAVGRRQLAG
jgi:hypothetical protein